MSNSKYLILVGTDYSEPANLAFQRALELAGQEQHVELHVVNVQFPVGDAGPTMGVGGFAMSLAAAKATLQDYVTSMVTAFEAATGGRPFEKLVTHVRIDEPGHQIAQLAADLEADLVVVGTASRRGISRLLLGSVAETVMRLAPCPVLVVRPKSIPEPGPQIEPPCPRCVAARRTSNGAQQWCEQHSERHGQRHTYHQSDRAGAETNFPLVTPS
jgi:nucleotide-binding universal stress UspA family protein